MLFLAKLAHFFKWMNSVVIYTENILSVSVSSGGWKASKVNFWLEQKDGIMGRKGGQDLKNFGSPKGPFHVSVYTPTRRRWRVRLNLCSVHWARCHRYNKAKHSNRRSTGQNQTLRKMNQLSEQKRMKKSLLGASHVSTPNKTNLSLLYTIIQKVNISNFNHICLSFSRQTVEMFIP